MPIDDHAGLAPEELAALEREVGGLGILAEVVTWGLAQRPPCLVSDVIAQDEFTNDVVVPYRHGLHLVFDCT